MSTAISLLYVPIRVVLGDRDPSVQKFTDSAIADAVKTVILLQKLPGFSLTLDGAGITPDLALPDPNKLALMIYHVARLFVNPEPDSYSFRTRALSESFGSLKNFLVSLEGDIHLLENGSMIDGEQSFYTFLSGMAGLPLWEVMTTVNIKAPFQTATVSRGGISLGSS